MISSNAKFKRDNLQKPVVLNDGLAMLNISTGKYTVLNRIGARIWDLTAVETSVEEIVEHLIKEFNISKEECSNSVELYVEKLAEENLIVYCRK